jgi:hypothetical protein
LAVLLVNAQRRRAGLQTRNPQRKDHNEWNHSNRCVSDCELSARAHVRFTFCQKRLQINQDSTVTYWSNFGSEQIIRSVIRFRVDSESTEYYYLM